MLIECPDCKTRMKPKPPANTPAGAKVRIRCRCGTSLQFTMPGRPVDRRAEEITADLKRFTDRVFGAGFAR
jgi:hypothetical protein